MLSSGIVRKSDSSVRFVWLRPSSSMKYESAPPRWKPATYEPSDRIITSSRKSRTGSRSHSAGRVISLSLSSVVLGKFVSFGIFDERASHFRRRRTCLRQQKRDLKRSHALH